MTRGSHGTLRLGSDFGYFEDNIAGTGLASAVVYGTGYVGVGQVGLVSVNEGSLAWTIDEDGGILAITTDSGDDDNACLLVGRLRPANGGVQMEARFKFNSATLAGIFVGFSETMAFDTPVVPAEFATATMTYNGTGGMMGASLDTDGTTDDFRILSGDAGAATGGSGNGARASETITADEWYLVRTEIEADGNGLVYVGHKGDAMDLIRVASAVQGKSFTGAGVTPGDQQYAVCMFENRSAAARLFEVDYLFARGFRDWANT